MEMPRTWCRLKTGESRRVVCLAAWKPPRMASSEATGGICANLSAARRAVQTNSLRTVVVANEDLTLPRVSREHGSFGAHRNNGLWTTVSGSCSERRLSGVLCRRRGATSLPEVLPRAAASNRKRIVRDGLASLANCECGRQRVGSEPSLD